MNQPLNVSTIIPTYNRAHLVRRAVDSALQASSPGDEVIVVDDGSTDNTAQVLAQYGDRIRYFKITNCGLASARNFGIRQSDKALVAFLDDDDEWIPEKLTLQRQLMQARPEVLFSFSNFYSILADGIRVNEFVFKWGQQVQSWERITGSSGQPYSNIASLPKGVSDFNVYIGDIYYHQMLDDYVLPTTMLVRRTPNFDPACFVDGLRFLESWTYSSHLAKLGPAAYLDYDTACQHGHEGPRLTDADELLQIKARVKVLEGQWGNDPLFLKEHGDDYVLRLNRERLMLIKELIANTMLEEARIELGKFKGQAPASLKLLAHSPKSVVNLALTTRNGLKKILR